MPQMSEVEAQAIAIVWEKEGGVGNPPEEDQIRILAQVRERAALIEREAVEMGMARMREGRRNPRRHQRIAIVVFLAMGLLVALVLLIGSLIRG